VFINPVWILCVPTPGLARSSSTTSGFSSPPRPPSGFSAPPGLARSSSTTSGFSAQGLRLDSLSLEVHQPRLDSPSGFSLDSLRASSCRSRRGSRRRSTKRALATR